MSGKTRTSITQTASTLFVTYAVNNIISSVTNGHSRPPHQLNIRFVNLSDVDDADRQIDLQTMVHVWVDIGREIGVEFIIDFLISRERSGLWSWNAAPIKITTYGVPQLFLMPPNTKDGIRPLCASDEKIMSKYQREHDLTKRPPSS